MTSEQMMWRISRIKHPYNRLVAYWLSEHGRAAETGARRPTSGAGTICGIKGHVKDTVGLTLKTNWATERPGRAVRAPVWPTMDGHHHGAMP